MQDIALTAKSHLDFSGLGELKAKAKQDQEGAAQEVGRQFEAMFVQMIFKSVRDANDTMKSDLMSSAVSPSTSRLKATIEPKAETGSQASAFS